VNECIFCRIVRGELPSRMVYEDEHVVAFHDVRPQAPTHVLVVPRRHVDSIREADPETIARLFEDAREVASRLDPEGRGFRLVVNTGPDGGQTVPHLHVHVLVGRFFSWPPG
jgi:histidine triad (HIT) family protein